MVEHLLHKLHDSITVDQIPLEACICMVPFMDPLYIYIYIVVSIEFFPLGSIDTNNGYQLHNGDY